jgi:DNA-binding LytR/AlgR family response regulator
MNATPARALIAEDEPLLAAHLQAELAQLWPELQVLAAVGDGLRAAEQALALRPEVCFLDVRMPGASGLDAAQAIVEDWPEGTPLPLLVFVTAYESHALQAFEAQAADYLVKPLDRTRLATSVARLKARLAERQPAGGAAAPGAAMGIGMGMAMDSALEPTLAQLRALLADPAVLGAATPRLEVIQAQASTAAGTVVHLVPVEEVIYFEAADKVVRVLTAEREHLIRTSLRELLPQLDPARFWQVHRGTVVQARCIAQARRDETGRVTLHLRGRPETLAVSRLYAARFKGM